MGVGKSKGVMRLAIIMAALFAYASCKKGEGTAKAAQQEKPLHVETVAVAKQRVPRKLTVTGTLKPGQQTELAAGASGKVISTKVERGDSVKAGALLISLDKRSMTASAKEAEAQRTLAETRKAQAQRDCTRMDALFRSETISQAEYDRMKSECEAAKSSQAAAEAHESMISVALGDSNIRAPFSGVIAERYVNAGEYVMPATKVVSLMSVDPLRLEITVPEALVGNIREKMEVSFAIAGDAGYPRRGVVRYVGPSVRVATRDQVIEAIVDNKDNLLRPGMFVTAQIVMSEEVLPVVPKNAVQEADGLPMLFVVTAGKLEQRYIDVATELQDTLAVTKGVSEGERVVVPFSDQLRDGLTVN